MKLGRTFPAGFPDRLIDAMNRKGMSCAQLARRVYCDRKSIYAYIHGDTSPSATTLARMCHVLGVTADWLLFGKEEKT